VRLSFSRGFRVCSIIIIIIIIIIIVIVIIFYIIFFEMRSKSK